MPRSELITAAIGIGAIVNLVPFLVGIGATYHGAPNTANDGTGLHGMVTANHGAKESACYGTANGAAQNLLTACILTCNVAGIGIAIGPAAGLRWRLLR